MKECQACKATYDDMFMYCPICAKPLADKTTSKRKVSSEQEKTEPKLKSENTTGVKQSKKAEVLRAASLSLDPDKKKPASKAVTQKEDVKAAPKAIPAPEPVVAAVPVPPKRAPAPRAIPAPEPVVAAVPVPPKRAPAPRVMPAPEPVVAAVPMPQKRAPTPRPVTATVSLSPFPAPRIPVTSVPARPMGAQPQVPSFAVVAEQKISQAVLETDSYYDDVIPEDYGEAAEKKKINKMKMIQAGAMIIGLIILIVIVAMNL